MSRDDGFRVADVDVGILDDPKVRALIRSTGDEATIARCLVAFVAVITSSWDRGQRITLEDAAPVWLTGLEDLAGRLALAGLLDDEERIPEKSWEAWFGPARDRRDRFRKLGQKGGLSTARSTDSSSVRSTARSSPSVRPTGHTVPTVLPSVARDDDAREDLRGLRPPETPQEIHDAGAQAIDHEGRIRLGAERGGAIPAQVERALQLLAIGVAGDRLYFAVRDRRGEALDRKLDELARGIEATT